jgi:hypothetical protein
MNPEQQRIAIAEVCGWKRFQRERRGLSPNARLWGDIAVGGQTDRAVVPNYLSDLNAMHEAEKVLMTKQRVRYTDTLLGIISHAEETWWSCAHATAAQRAEAFLRTLNLWKD